MKVSEALALEGRTLISLAGGGGKTAAMFRLAEELKAKGCKVLVTTTTAIYCPEADLYEEIYIWNNSRFPGIFGLKPEPGSITVTGRFVTEEGKLKGLPLEWIDKVYESAVYDAILVEADGAKGRPVKAPDKHEPVIPRSTTTYIGIIGMDCYGKAIDSKWVHRHQLLLDISEKAEGNSIDSEVITKLVLHPEGLFKQCPAAADRILLLNKAENSLQYLAAKHIGRGILKGTSDIKKILIGSLLMKDPIQFILNSNGDEESS